MCDHCDFCFLTDSITEPGKVYSKEFIFAPLPNYQTMHDHIGLVIQTITSTATAVNVSVPLLSLRYRISLEPGSGPYNLDLPVSLVVLESGFLNTTVHVESDNDIFVLTYNQHRFSSDTYTLFRQQIG